MKSFNLFLLEVLNPYQQFFVDQGIDSGESRLVDFSDHIFDPKNEKIPGHTRPGPTYPQSTTHDVRILPYTPPPRSAPKTLTRHLDLLGYDIHDYENGLARRRGAKNPIKISRILSSDASKNAHSNPSYLSRFNLHDLASNEYEKDRAFSRQNKDLEVMITRDPRHVAEQSTNKRWRSCMALGTCPGMEDDMEAPTPEQLEKELGGYDAPGMYHKKTIDDIHGGAHMAYLIKKGDYDLKDPLARLSIKPFNSLDYGEKADKHKRNREMNPYHTTPAKDLEPDHTILRPIGQVYGMDHGSAASDDFHDFVTKFTETHFPEKRRHMYYELDPRVQRDRGTATIHVNKQGMFADEVRNKAAFLAMPKKLLRATKTSHAGGKETFGRLYDTRPYKSAFRQATKLGMKIGPNFGKDVDQIVDLANKYDEESIEKSQKAIENTIISFSNFLFEYHNKI